MLVFRANVVWLTIIIGLTSETFCSPFSKQEHGKFAAKVNIKNIVSPDEENPNDNFEAAKKTINDNSFEETLSLPKDVKFNGNSETTISAQKRVTRDVYQLPSSNFNNNYTSLPRAPHINCNPVNQQWQLPRNNNQMIAPYNCNNPPHPNTNYPVLPTNAQTYPAYPPNNYPNQQNNYYGQVNNTRPYYPAQPSSPHHPYSSTPNYYTTQRTPQYPSQNNVSPYPSHNNNPSNNYPGYQTPRPGYPSNNPHNQPNNQYPNYNNTYPSYKPTFDPSRPTGPYNPNLSPTYPSYNNNPFQVTTSRYNQNSSFYPTNGPNQSPNSYQPFGQQYNQGHNPYPNQAPSNYPNTRPSDPNQFPGHSPNTYNQNPQNTANNNFYYPSNNNMGPNYDPRKNPPQNFSY